MTGVLFAHPNFPGQFGFLAQECLRRGIPIAAVASNTGRGLPGVPIARWTQVRSSTPGIFPAARRPELDFIGGQGAAEAAALLRDNGFDPDLIIAHPAKGSSLFLREIFPAARQIVHGEYYHHPVGGDTDFDPEFRLSSPEQRLVVRALNAPLAMAYAEADWIVCPTAYQKSLLPSVLHPRISVIHEGVDTDVARPNPDATLRLADGRTLDRSTPVITYVSRRFEPLRGFHVFLRALPALLDAVPDAEVLIIGADHPSVYGFRAPEGTSWKAHFLRELEGRLDPARVHFTDVLPHGDMLAAMALSRAHVYYTYPFVLSWSLLEAMAAGSLVIASDTPPLHDAVTHGINGLLLDFFDVGALSRAIIDACRDPTAFDSLRANARATVLEKFDRSRLCLPAWMALIDGMRGATRA
jgi:glycosyltransferase involved in cell wall biosynthesis